ncbi:cdc42 effector protein 3 [Osmerus mordax]|uniref:cdc42 effector protein 3 n=1 Tax=Osmerus mordax TaxID=8014 RepID=UPI0035107CC6
MPAKAPIYLKPINSKKGRKCRLRDILSPDMISPPLGDFRHTIHIGRGGERDAFGDMSFLQGKFELLRGKGEIARPQYSPHCEFLRANSASDASFAETPSPVLKNAISLPSIGGCQALTLPLLSTTMFSLPAEPLEGMIGPTSPMRATDSPGELEILQMDALLRSMEVFSSDHAPKTTGNQLRPDVLLDLLEKPEKPSMKKTQKSNTIYNVENEINKPPSRYIHDKSSGMCKDNNSFNDYSRGNGVYNGNGNFSENTNIQNIRNGNVIGKDSLKMTYNGNGDFNGTGQNNDISNGNVGFNGNGNCNGYGSFNSDITLCCEKDVPDCNGDWVDRDSGVEEGRICDLDFEFLKEKSASQESLSQITGSMLSLELDLGPSILDDVLNIMDNPKAKSRP